MALKIVGHAPLCPTYGGACFARRLFLSLWRPRAPRSIECSSWLRPS